MDLKHTPGPWHVEWAMAQGGDAHHVCDRRSMAELSVIATVHFHDDTDGETEANARLIAASPEMLEALLLFVEYESASESSDDVAMMIAYAEFKRAAHAAIAAATGE